MEIAEEILRAYEPTEEDISKELTDEQLVKLCQRTRCRVDMWKWNVLEDFAQHFKDAGRLKGKSKKFIHKLLLKAYHRNKELFLETEKDKDTERMEEWAYRKKNSLLQLNMWEYDENVQNLAQTQGDEDMSHSEEEELLRKEYENEAKLQASHSSTSNNNEEELLQGTITTLNITVLERQEEELIETVFQSIEDEDLTQKKQQTDHISLEDVSIVKEMMQFNSESMTIDTQSITECTDEPPEQPPEECFSINLSDLQETPVQPIIATQSETYDDFHERMPLTSTQDADFTALMPVLCLGPKRAGKSHLLKALQDNKAIDETSYSVPTIGTSIYNIRFPHKSNAQTKNAEAAKSTTTTSPTDAATSNNMKTSHQLKHPCKSIRVMEIGGTMAPLWRQYFDNVEKIIYVVDTSNLCQISAAGVLLYSILAEPRLQKVKFLLALSKMDYAYRQMRNEALLMLQMSKLQKQIRQNITIVETSSVTRDGFDKIYDWLQMP